MIGGVVGASALDAATNAQVRLGLARDELDGLLRIQLSEETGLRGFLATGQRYFLEPDGPPNEMFDERAGRLRKELSAARMPNGVGLVDDLERYHQTWTSAVKDPLLKSPSRRDALAKQTYGKLLTDQMGMAAATLRDRLRTSGTEVQSGLRRRINATVALSVGTVTLFAIATLVLGLQRARAIEALAYEHSMVSALQQTLRVEGVNLPRMSVGWAYTSATREALVGGDLIDTWRVNGERGWFLIADASGKGIEAARHSAFVQYAIRALAAECDDPALILERFNRLFLDTFDDPGIFVVLLLGSFDARTGSMRYASAGHGSAYIRRGAAVEQLMPTGSIIGIDTTQVYGEAAIALQPGDVVVLATDGLTECRDAAGEMLGDEGVMALLHPGILEPQALCDRLVAEVERRSAGEVHDDLAILILRILFADDATQAATFTILHGDSNIGTL
ncbi:MAG: hypothetical protein NVS3B16_26650 [Vulcanimicrobiaceae bacterium]